MSTITSVTFQPSPVAPGQTVTMTVSGDWQEADQVTITAPDGATGSGTLELDEPATVTGAGGANWSLVSNNGTQAVFTAVAVPGCVVTVQAGDATATATVPVQAPCMYGVNARVYTTVTPSLTGIGFVKCFATSAMPSSWPGLPPVQPIPHGMQALVCITPPPADLLAGRLDAALAAFTAGAPEGSWLTAWQEGNDPGNGVWKAPGITSPADVAAMHAYLRDWCAKNAPHVVYGQDFGSSPIYGAHQDCTLYTCPGLGFYSFDGYDRPVQNAAGQWVSPHTAAQVFAGLGQIRAKWPNATLAITETNTHRVTQDPGSAGQWFTDTYAVAKSYGCVLYCTWWGPPGTTIPEWQLIEFTPGAAYIGALNAIAEDCAA